MYIFRLKPISKPLYFYGAYNSHHPRIRPENSQATSCDGGTAAHLPSEIRSKSFFAQRRQTGKSCHDEINKQVPKDHHVAGLRSTHTVTLSATKGHSCFCLACNRYATTPNSRIPRPSAMYCQPLPISIHTQPTKASRLGNG